MKKLTGGKLKLGLSAAGYLDPDIFEFYQKNGIHLLSGYGMTEATGGITMKNALGVSLGIKTKILFYNFFYIAGRFDYIHKYDVKRETIGPPDPSSSSMGYLYLELTADTISGPLLFHLSITLKKVML